MSFISVIIPNHQCAKWLPITLDSCLAQKEYVREIIVIDDHSTDNSLEVLNAYRIRYPDLVRVYRNKEKGGNHARNYGYQLSGGAYIQWLDADDQVLPGKFAGQLEAFGKFPGTDIVYSDWQLDTYDEEGKLIRQEFKQHRPYEDFLAELLQNNWSPPHNYLLKRGMAGELGEMNAWNPDTPVLQDREYFTLAAIAGAKFQYVPGNFSVYNRWNRGSVSQAKRNAGATLVRLCDQFLERIEKSDAFGAGQKAGYRKMLITTKLIDKLAGKRILVRDPELRFRNIHWPLLKTALTRVKFFITLALNSVLPA